MTRYIITDEWLAGWLDSNGTIVGLEYRGQTQPRVTFGAPRRDLMEAIAEAYDLDPERIKQERRGERVRYIIFLDAAEDIIHFLCKFYHHMNLKRAQAEKAIELAFRIADRKGVIKNRITSEEREIRTALCRSINDFRR